MCQVKIRSVPSEVSTPHRIAQRLLGQEPGAWINGRRDHGLSFRAIAAELDVITDTESFSSYETIRKWHRQWVQERFTDRLEAEVGGAA